MRRLALCLLLFACGEGPLPADKKLEPIEFDPLPPAPGRITYDHILIAFRDDDGKRSYPRAKTFRSKEEARKLAYSLLDRIRSGADFVSLKSRYSDDRDPKSGTALGPYVAVDDGVRREELEDIPRRNFHPLLAHVIFSLKVDEVKMADWHAKDCPDGWHIVKRLETVSAKR
jgi:parvulin-like peptidyl-prolyl isomerase